MTKARLEGGDGSSDDLGGWRDGVDFARCLRGNLVDE
jgi:hypothetical protein